MISAPLCKFIAFKPLITSIAYLPQQNEAFLEQVEASAGRLQHSERCRNHSNNRDQKRQRSNSRPSKHGVVHYIETTNPPIVSKVRCLPHVKLKAAKEEFSSCIDRFSRGIEAILILDTSAGTVSKHMERKYWCAGGKRTTDQGYAIQIIAIHFLDQISWYT
ncbi:hypothetical protein NPIL_146071 [Nephila pilipes]|uniref:Uncharacterized protein n=1 Tax=Nephila pilipes TaxID=299642 RepID=A0A8X6QAM9_NEPPI|nr:hypothetical protein NPIL_146071 [Nephila pilipes]